MPELSAVIITHNEEKRIGTCLKSVSGLADEIVVVDSFSTDRTEQICVDMGARFVKNKFEGHIQQKNFALGLAKHDHVLCLDADEELSPAMKASVLEAKNNWEHDAYSFNRLSWYCGKWIRHSTWYPSRKIRLIDRRKGRWDGINPHDALTMDEGCSLRQMKGDLLHYSYESVAEHIEKIHRYADLASKAYYEAGVKAGFLKLIINPALKFLRDYIFELGFLDGYYGWVIARLDARETYLKYSSLRRMYIQARDKQ